MADGSRRRTAVTGKSGRKGTSWQVGQGDPGISWLFQSKDPSVRYFTLSDVLCESEGSGEVAAAKCQIPNGQRLRALLSDQQADGGFGVNWYGKWSATHRRLVSVVELGVPLETGSR
jgi:hypothetical protein